MVKELTSGKPIKLILAFCLPLLVGNLFQQLYNMADSIIVGQYVGVQAFAAVGAVGSFSFLIVGFVLGMCSGFCIPVAQYFGAGDYENLRKCVAHILWLSVVLSAVITVLTMIFTRPLLTLIQTPEDIFEDAYRYIIIIFGGISTVFLYNILASLLRALGDSKTPLYFLMIAATINVGLDLLFVAVMHMGVAGTAIATIIAQTLSGISCLVFVIKKFPILHVKKSDFKFNIHMTSRLLSNGLPMALQFSITAVGAIILQSAVNTLGSDVVAAISAAGKVQAFASLPMETLGIAMATYCSQNLGAQKIKRVKQGVNSSLIASLVLCLCMGLIMVFFGTEISKIFIVSESPVIFDRIRQYLFSCSIFYPVLGVLFIYRNSIQGLGHGFTAMIAGIFELVARSVVGLCFVGTYGYAAACFSNPAAWLAADLLLIPAYYVIITRLVRTVPDLLDSPALAVKDSDDQPASTAVDTEAPSLAGSKQP